MTSPNKIYRNPKLDKVFDELRPILRAEIDAGEFGKPLNEPQQPLTLFQQTQQQLLKDLKHCRQQIAYYEALENIYQQRYERLLQSTSCLPCYTPKSQGNSRSRNK